MDAAWLKDRVRDIPDYPQPGVVFKDITPLLADPGAFSLAVDALAGPYNSDHIDKVIGIEARGFVFAAPVAYRHAAGFVPVRKPGKLPATIEHEEYELEYGSDRLEIHHDGVRPGERVLIVDDVLATGGTASATIRLAQRLGGEVIGLAFLIELEFLGGRDRLGSVPIHSVLSYS